MKTLKVVLSLITKDNDYQRYQATVAEETAQRLGIDLQVMFADNNAILQTQHLLTAIRSAGGARPDAIIVEPVGTGMPQVAKAACDSGVGWIVLNREADYLVPLRQTSSVPIGSIDCDNVQVGRIQGQQFAALLPKGGAILYVEGPATDASRQRRAGVAETLPASIDIRPVRGNWTEESAFQAVSSRLQLQASLPPNVDLIGCQNDSMAKGSRKAVEASIGAQHREQWLKIPITGCDGVPTVGQNWVRKGLLAATVAIPALTGIALELLVKALATGTQLDERTLTKPASFPSIEELSRRGAR
jgi:ribose transport system substrate-binding protein